MSAEEPKIEPAAAAPRKEARADGIAYIDEEAPCDDDNSRDDKGDDGSDDESVGSSIVESVDSEREPHGGWPEDPEPEADEDEDEEDEDALLEWGVEDEDWELADGDFTKQYNRVRQSYAAVDIGTGATSASATASTSTARPLPARNANAAARRARAPPQAQSGTSGKKLLNPGILGGVSANPKSAGERANQKDKADRATHEQVLDARTRLVLSGLVNRGFFGVIDGVVSTGKEANVYLAFPGPNPPPNPSPYPSAVAVKIYRTSILNFRARQNYIVGEHRFKGGYTSVKNPRKMVRLWAEKELRNLRRLVQGGIRAPIVIEQRENVLVMEFLGKDGTASPRLKDADISVSKLPRLYGEILVAMRRMFHVCRLVHADLSEYNILYHASHPYIIDVSQSVEQEHPSAFDFLRSDIRNIDDFFTKRSNGQCKTLGLRRAWNFIVDENIGLSAEEEVGDEGEDRLLDVLREWLDRVDAADLAADAEERRGAAGGADGAAGATEDASQTQQRQEEKSQEQANRSQVDDAVFFSSYIPRSLGEVYDPERDVEVLRSGKGDSLIYAGVTGLKGLKIDDKEVNKDKADTSAPLSQPVSASASAPAPTADSTAAPTTDSNTTATATDTPAPAPARTGPPSALADPSSPKSPKKARGVRWEDEATPAASDAEEDAEEQEEEVHERRSRGFRHEDKEEKKARKKALKEEVREKRKHKMPKAEKQRLIKKSSGK